MFNSVVLTITFTYKGVVHTRQIDKIIFSYDKYSYTLYQFKGKDCNYNLLKCGKWWQVDVVKPLPGGLVEILGDAIDAVDS